MNPVVPILTIPESQDWEKRLLTTPQLECEALYRAGNLLGEAIERDFQEIVDWPSKPRVLLIAGKGHNAGDGLLAARWLLRIHPKMELTLLWEGERSLRPLVLEIWRELQASDLAKRISIFSPESFQALSGDESHNSEKHVTESPSALQKILRQEWTLWIDALFGMGFRPPLPEKWHTVIHALNQSDMACCRIAVDTPSGLSEQLPADSSSCFRADFTYAMGTPKAPLFLKENLAFVGRIRFLDIDFFEKDPSNYKTDHEFLIHDKILTPLRCPRIAREDKRHHGRVGIVAGSHRYPGAGLLVTLAALKAGGGLVTSMVPEAFVPGFAAEAPEAIWMEAPVTPEGSISMEVLRDLEVAAAHWDVMVMGSGMTQSEETFCLAKEWILRFPGFLILDADFLRSEIRDFLKKRPREFLPVILLPHRGEWDRLTGGLPDTRLRDWAKEHRALVILKGPLTRISDGKSVWISSRGGPVLGRGGSGDMLAGMMGSLFARFGKSRTPIEIAGMGLYWQGITAEKLAYTLGENAVRSRELLNCLASALKSD